jgi:predicted alpha-1,2-mannosidase
MRKLLILLLAFLVVDVQAQTWRDVNPRIGSEGDGRVFIGPTAPFGMVKPGPDALSMPNAGWAPMPAPLKGFSQTHVSGTGGGQKYGNVLLQPYLSTDRMRSVKLLMPDGSLRRLPLILQRRETESITLGRYATQLENGIGVELTASDRSALYRFSYPKAFDGPSPAPRLLVDAASFLGMDTIPNKRETQQYCASHIASPDNHTLTGFTTVRGGWNNGDPYTVFFCVESSRPFALRHLDEQYAQVEFSLGNDSIVNVCVGISFISSDKARQNICRKAFDEQLSDLRTEWEDMLSKVPYNGQGRNRRIFYTALYHTLLMPSDRTGENPKWQDGPYYDDFYALWDTYRTSFPLLIRYYPQRAADMINALLAIYQHEGYMPDARSGNCNGRTQGGSNAEVVIAEAFAQHLKGIDYKLALKAMVKDAEVPPVDDEKEGRGGLNEYKTLGYILYGIPRAGTRTVEYSYDDWCLAQVARGLGKKSLYKKYMKRSENWKNLWRSDYEWQGMRGFIMPKDAQGHWLDSVEWGHSKAFRPKIAYRPDTKVAPWHIAWWDTFFYEALSAEYSLSIPHDVPALIKLCGDSAAFRRRLDTFFANGHYNVGNEPSFLTPYLYHYIGRPDLSSQRVREIALRYFSDRPDGLPGNDDSGAMSAWLVWAMLGEYPVAGQGKWLKIDPVVFPEPASATVHFTLNRQYRTWPLHWEWEGDTLRMTCHDATYLIPRLVVEGAKGFCWDSPYKGSSTYHCQGTFLFLSRQALNDLKSQGFCSYDQQLWRLVDDREGLLHLRADVDDTEMWVSTQSGLPLVVRMQGNPLGIDWYIDDAPNLSL